jgi:phosphohistidine phosphatase SixA
MKRIALALAAWSALACPVGAAAEELDGQALFAALRRGGYVVYLRHSITDLSQADAKPVTIGDCATQRNLSADGRELAAAIGTAFKRLGIRVGSVTSSPFCRAEETARLAFGSFRADPALEYTFGMSKEAAGKAAAELRQELSRAPASGENSVIVGHVTNLREAAGVWPKTEGGGVVFEPRGEVYRIVGSFTAANLIAAANQIAAAN